MGSTPTPVYQRDEQPLLIAAIVVGFIFRLSFLSFVEYRTDTGDAALYSQIAENISRGHFSASTSEPFEPTLLRPPLVPAAIALARVVSASDIAFQLFQCAIGALAAVMAFLGLRRAIRIPEWTLWLLVLSPADAIYCGALLSEPLATFFLVGGVSVVFLPLRARWLLCGVSFGLLALTRDVFLGLPLLAVVASTLAFERSGVRRRAVLLFVGFAVVVCPWTARNWVAVGDFVPVSRGFGGQNLWIGTWETDGSWQSNGLEEPPAGSYRSELERSKIADALARPQDARDAALKEIALERISTEPLLVIGRWLVRAPRMWVGTRTELFEMSGPLARGEPLWWLLKAGMLVLNLGILTLAAFAAFRIRQRELYWLLAPLVYSVIAYLPFHNTEPRYSQPPYFIVIALAAAGSSLLAAQIRGGTAPASR